MLLLLHTPPPSHVELYCNVVAVHIGELPLSVPALAPGLTAKVLPADTGLPQPPDVVYVILVVPDVTAVTRPVPEFTVATDVLLLLHTPPIVPLVLYVAVVPVHSREFPLITPALTVGGNPFVTLPYKIEGE